MSVKLPFGPSWLVALLPISLLAGAVVIAPLVSLAAGLLILGIIACWQFPRVVVVGCLAFTLFEETLLRWLPTVTRFSVEAIILLLFGLIVARQLLLSGKLTYHRAPITGWFALFLGVVLLSAWVNQADPLVTLLGVRPLVRYIALFYVITLLDWPQRVQKQVVLIVLLLATMQALLGLMQFIGGPIVKSWFTAPDVEFAGEFIRRNSAEHNSRFFIFGTIARYDRFANFLALALLLLISMGPMVRSVRLPRRWMMLLIALALLLSLSRQAWVGLLVGIAALFVLYAPKLSVWLMPLLILLVATMLLTVDLPLDLHARDVFVGERLLEPFTAPYWRKDRVGSRIYTMRVVAPKLLASAPWLGYGAGRYGSLVTRLYPTPVYESLDLPLYYTDNFVLDVQWVMLLGQLGLVGTVAYGAIITRMAFFARAILKRANATLWARQLATTVWCWSALLMTIAWFGPNFEVRVVSLPYWMIAALLCVNETIDETAAS